MAQAVESGALGKATQQYLIKPFEEMFGEVSNEYNKPASTVTIDGKVLNYSDYGLLGFGDKLQLDPKFSNPDSSSKNPWLMYGIIGLVVILILKILD